MAVHTLIHSVFFSFISMSTVEEEAVAAAAAGVVVDDDADGQGADAVTTAAAGAAAAGGGGDGVPRQTGANMALAAAAVLVESVEMPEGSPVCGGYDFNKGVNYDMLFQSLRTHGFQATNLGVCVSEVRACVSE